ncbi:MAG: thioredoxin domain-containing protein [Nitrospina sp.]|mgnify:CR=1 FL=1|jgi:protein-disulfide isomerase|nr:thioredoxin domain-containing protein [Nitrospina sp.]MBT5631961.1 thioredoxin domain-containing protein [Nitrospina sp.]
MIFRLSCKLLINKIVAVPLILFAIGNAVVFADGIKTPIYSNNPIVAEVDGKPVYLDELKHVRIQEALNQLYDMQTRALKEKILDRLIEKHPDLILDQVPKVTEAEIKKFYDSNSGIKELGSLTKVSPEIRDYLEKSFRQVHIERQYQHAVQKGWAKVYLTPPNDFHLVAGVGTAMLWAKEEVPSTRRVFVLEYSDFQCPFCKRVQNTLQNLRKKYPNEVQFGYRHFPLPFHKEAKVLAQAVECARDQNKFWELQELFYENDSNATSENEIMKRVKLAGIEDIPAFQQCLRNGKYEERIQNDIRDGVALGIQGTPTFILGAYDPEFKTVSGKMFSGAVSEEKFIREIERFLASTRTEAKLNR